MTEQDKKRIGKFLSLVLRHSPETIGIELDKQRYAFNEKRNKIRANQGHSIDIDLALSPVKPPEFLYHGTATRFLDSIRKEGIVKGSRKHVHLSKDKETATNVGSRHGKPIVLTVLSGKMDEDGVLFYQAENGVWLTEYVGVEYISK